MEVAAASVTLFLVLACALVGYAFWIYTRVELSVPGARRLALIRAVVLVVVLLLLFDPRLPAVASGSTTARWALIDASASMSALRTDGTVPWDEARARAEALEAEGWNVVVYGDGALRSFDGEQAASGQSSELAPALRTAAESGAREVRVVSDLRIEDAVAVRAALESLPIETTLEAIGSDGVNAGVGAFTVSDVLQPDGAPTAEVEVFGGVEGDSIVVEILEEGVEVARVSVPAPSPGLTATGRVTLPPAAESGRRRYTARIAQDGDAFAPDDGAAAYASIGYEAGALVLISAEPDWEPRYLLPVLEDVTGLTSVGYLRTGPDRYVRLGAAADRGTPTDSATVRRAASEAALLVVHGLGSESDPWLAEWTGRPGRRLVFPTDPGGAAPVGAEVDEVREGEWYASPDVPTSPIAGALAGVDLQGLPPLSSVMVPAVRPTLPPLQLQLRGAGAPESALLLVDRPSGRSAVVLASGFWRWAMRANGREPYRRLWSGVAGWLLADERVAASEPRPVRWVTPAGEPVRWTVPGDSTSSRIVIRSGEEVVADTTVRPAVEVETGVLPAGPYAYTVLTEAGDTAATGRFDVARDAGEMRAAPLEPEVPVRAGGLMTSTDGEGRPLRTSPWPYLLVIVLLCAEWIVRRRSGLR